jgi:hypothetical protein
MNTCANSIKVGYFKGQCHEIFNSKLFPRISLPRSPFYPNSTIPFFEEILRIYSAVLVAGMPVSMHYSDHIPHIK